MQFTAHQTSTKRASVRPIVPAAIALVTAATFAADLVLPLGIAAGIPYVAPVLAASWLPGHRYIMPVAVVCSLLIGIGFLFSPGGADLWAVIPNRVLGVGAIWTVGVMTLSRKRGEEALAEREAETRAVLNSTADAVLAVRADGRIASANPAATRMFGYENVDLVDLPLRTLLCDSDGSQFDSDRASLLSERAGADSIPLELAGKRNDGSEFPMEVAAETLLTTAGTQHIVTIHDITNRRILERHLLLSGEEQRQSMAHLLNEHLGQSLTGLNLISRHLAGRLASTSNPEAQEAADLAQLLHEADTMVLRAAHTLAPVQSDDGFAEAIKRLAASIMTQYGIRFDVVSAREVHSDRLEAAELYRIVQSIVEWALTEGRPNEIKLTVGGSEDVDAVTVRLDGEIPDASTWKAAARQIQFRARLLDRTIRYVSDGNGTVSIVCRRRGG